MLAGWSPDARTPHRYQGARGCLTLTRWSRPVNPVRRFRSRRTNLHRDGLVALQRPPLQHVYRDTPFVGFSYQGIDEVVDNSGLSGIGCYLDSLDAGHDSTRKSEVVFHRRVPGAPRACAVAPRLDTRRSKGGAGSDRRSFRSSAQVVLALWSQLTVAV
jgi:hypothetical protein